MSHTTTEGYRVIYHEPICPDCGSFNIERTEVLTTDGFTETALECRTCGTAWPLACVTDWQARTTPLTRHGKDGGPDATP